MAEFSVSSFITSAKTKDVAVSVNLLRSFDEDVNPSKKRNCCYRFWRCIYVHGSIVGPAPCSFLWLCGLCQSQRNKCVNNRLRRSSFSTKLMYVIFLGVVMMFSSFFIIAYPEHNGVQVAEFSPCISETAEYHEIPGWWGDCKGHAGYFIVYRTFFAWIILLLALILCTIGVISSKETCRPAVHQGFWLPKFIIFFALCAMTILFISVKSPFDETFMFVGLSATVIFSIPQLISFLDLCDVIVIFIKSHPICKTWKIGYWGLTGLFYAVSFGILITLCMLYTKRSPLKRDNLGEAVDYGTGSYCVTNIVLIVYCFVVGIIVTIAMVFHMAVIKSKKYPHVGVMHASMVFAHTVIYVYISLGNTEDLECRVVWYPYNYNMDSLDVTFTLEGFIHVIIVWFTLLYFTLFEGPRSNAPLSKLLNWICCKSQVTRRSLSHMELAEGPSGRLLTLEERKSYLLHNDEANQLQYNWALFHVFLILGSLSMMMGMTNFFRPNADGPNASNYPAFVCKVIVSPMAVTAFLAPLIISWVIDREYKTTDDEVALETPSLSTEIISAGPIIAKVDRGNTGTLIFEKSETEPKHLGGDADSGGNATGDPGVVSEQMKMKDLAETAVLNKS